MKAVVAAFNQEKALAFSVITNLRMELLKHYCLRKLATSDLGMEMAPV